MKALIENINRKQFTILLVALCIVIVLLIAALGYYFAILMPKQQNEIFKLKEEQYTQDKHKLSEEIEMLKSEISELKLESTPIADNSETDPTSTVESGCNQAKLDSFRNFAISNGYSQEEVDSYITSLKANNCIQPSIPDTTKEVDLSGIEQKLDRIQMCQSYGICY